MKKSNHNFTNVTIKKILKSIPSVILILLLTVIFFFMFNLGKNVDQPAGTSTDEVVSPSIPIDSLKICTNQVEQPECYTSDFPQPILTWQCEDNQGVKGEYGLELEIDNNPDFESIELTIREDNWVGEAYQVNSTGLKDNESYYWRVKVQNSEGTWSDWAVHEEPFTVAPLCE